MTVAMYEPAQRLDDLYKTLSPAPLLSPEELNAFYREELNAIRGGGDLVRRLALGLRRAHGGARYKALVMGHPGVGKSTELTRLVQDCAPVFETIRFSVTEQLDPVSFKPFDVLLVLLQEVVARTARPVNEGGAGKEPGDAGMRAVFDWFADKQDISKRSIERRAEATAGVDAKQGSWFANLLGLFASLKGELKYASVRDQQSVAYRLSRLDKLIEAANELLADCERLLSEATGREWLFMIEDFDKMGVSPSATEDFFVTYANAIRDLNAHLILNIPVALVYSSKAPQLPVGSQMVFLLPDTAVFQPDHGPHDAGRQALIRVLEARARPELFGQDQMQRLVVACGGNLRELFGLVLTAGDTAILRNARHIEARDATESINWLRTEYERRLGESPFDTAADGAPIPYERKADRLLRIYDGDQTAKVPDPVLYSLLRARAVQEFNGQRWFGVHPLVVDLLNAQGKIERLPDGTLPGGTF